MALPSDLSGLQIWFKADSLALADNTPVSAWNDSSTNARNTSQATSGKQPIFRTAQINGLPVVVFDGVDDTLASGTTWTVAPPTQFFVVGTPDPPNSADNTSFGYFHDSAGTAPTNRQAFGRLLGTAPNINDISAINVTGISYTENTTPTAIWSYVFNGASSFIWKNGTQQVTGNPGAQSINGITLGSRYTGDFNLNGRIAELFFFNRALSTSERAQMDSYLQDRYGIAVSDALPRPGLPNRRFWRAAHRSANF